MFLLAARFFLSAILFSIAGSKLYLESTSNDNREEGFTHPLLTDSRTLAARAYQRLEEGSPRDIETARSILNKLLVTNAASAEQWSTLGTALVQAGKIEEARYCFHRAGELAPNSVETDLAIANFHMSVKEGRSALPYLGKILAHADSYDDTVFTDFDALKLHFNEIVAEGGLPSDPKHLGSYFRHLIGLGDLANAREAWVKMRSYSPSDSLADQYVNFLISKGLEDEARAAWIDQLGDRETPEEKTALVLNAGFERDLANVFFDWRITPREHVKVDRDQEVFQSGHSSLRIQFDGGENLDYSGVSQRVFLRPGVYQLEAFVRTKDITTDEGVSLRVFNVQTEKLIGTNGWKRLEAKFALPTSAAVQIQVVRHPSLRFDNKIAGTAWIDGASLRRVN